MTTATLPVTCQAETFLAWLREQPGLGAFVVAKSDGVLTITFTHGLRLTLRETLPDDMISDRSHGAWTGC